MSWPATIVRDIGWFGDQGVTLFIILSGFGLTWGLLRTGAPARLPLAAFYRRRAARIYPLWWGAHVLFLVTCLLPHGLSLLNWRYYLSFAGLRFVPTAFYYFAPAWWYVGLIIQLYLVYPVFWRLLRDRGPTVLLAGGSLAGFAAIAIGPLLFHDTYLDVWQRGGCFVTRLPEFVLGIVLAWGWNAQPERMVARLRSPRTRCAALAVYVLATLLSFTLRGMIVAPFLLGTSAFCLLYPLADGMRDGHGLVARLGRQSYPIYLVHATCVRLFVPAASSFAWTSAGIGAALIATALLAAVLVQGTDLFQSCAVHVARRRGGWVVAGAGAGILAGLFALAIAADLIVTARDPQEIDGWGERIALAPSDRYGWTLAPGRTTRLRWESYDYRVTANALGFPGPLFAAAKAAGTLRVLVTGDAFSSAEGVDTDRGWPRLLQRDLARRSARAVEVANFAITGYGPNQEAAVVHTFVPRYHPDVLLIEMFANDVEDALISNAAFRASIGFSQPPPRGVRGVLELEQLRRWITLKLSDPLVSLIKRKPVPEGYFLGSFRFLERGRSDYDGEGVRISERRYREMAATAGRAGAHAIVVFVPAPVEVCGADALRYYPRSVNLADRTRFDRTLPEQRARRIAAAARLELWDLGPFLRSLPSCPYMSHNLHFTAAGNAAVADYLARRLATIR